MTMFNRPNVAGAVLQTPLLLINKLTNKHVTHDKGHMTCDT